MLSFENEMREREADFCRRTMMKLLEAGYTVPRSSRINERTRVICARLLVFAKSLLSFLYLLVAVNQYFGLHWRTVSWDVDCRKMYHYCDVRQ